MSSARGVIAAGHPATAEVGAEILAEGGNAVDAAVAAVLASFAAESPLTGFGAGGFMLVHDPGKGGEGSDVLIDFFVEAPGRDRPEREAELVPVPVYFDETPQTFNVGAASCGVPGTAAGLARALDRFGSTGLGDLVGPAIALAREGVAVNAMQAYIIKILEPILTLTEESAALYAPEGHRLEEGKTFRFPELGDALERYAAEGPEPFYRGEVAAAVSAWVLERGGTLGPSDLAAYEAAEREPIRTSFRDADVLTNPPPSSGGILIAYCLALLEELGDASSVEKLVTVMGAANSARDEDFLEGLYANGFHESFLDLEGIRATSAGLGEGLGSTTHIAVLDRNGMCASVTCSNGTGSGLVVPGTGVHVNNMLGEEDLNPLGFHRIEAGRRVPSMMAPTIVLGDGAVVLGLGSAGSNRIRSAILQTIIRVVEQGMSADEAVRAPRLHFEAGTVQAEPGIEEEGLKELEGSVTAVARWQRQNLYFGGVQAVARDPASGEVSGGGDPRRGGAAIVV